MFTYCPDCGTQTAAVDVDHAAGTVTCPDCRSERPFRSRPLHVVTGASGTGKTTAWRRLVGTVDAAVLDWDLMTFDDDGGYGDRLRDLPDGPRLGLWLRLCANLGRSGVPVVWFAGDQLPEDIEARPESRYFPRLRYRALTCPPETLRERLQDRRGWAWAREEGYPWADLDLQTAINRAQREAGADPGSPVETVDTGANDPDETAARLRKWVEDGS